jgi:predicted dehydrogenase
LNKSQPYGVLLVTGLRTHQENYALLFAADPRCRLIAVTDEPDVPAHRADWNEQFASEMDIPYIADLNEALAREDVDIVSVCAEHERRGSAAVRCAQAGKHLYLDKPMACSVSDADAVVAAVKAARMRSQIFSFIHNPWAKAAKQAVESGAVGELIAIHCDVMFAKGYTGTAPLVKPAAGWLGKPRKQDPHPKRFTFVDSKLELWTTGVYAVSLIRWITGVEVRTVFGVTANYFFAEHVQNDVEDFGVLALGLDGGITATVACGRIGWTIHPAGGPNRLHSIGTEGSLTVDAHKPRVEVYADEPPWTPPPVNPADPMSFWRSTQEEVETKPKESWVPLHGKEESPNDASRFIDCIESGRESEMSAKDGAAVVEVLMAGYVSAASGDVVALPLPR